MPKPHRGESREDYIARFMRETEDENRSTEQRLAIAFSEYRRKGKKKARKHK